MAEKISKDDIDELLNGSPEAEQAIVKQDTQKSPTKNQFFKPKQERRLRFEYKYRSPIIKKEDIVIDPETSEDLKEGSVIVQSLYHFTHNRNLYPEKNKK